MAARTRPPVTAHVVIPPDAPRTEEELTPEQFKQYIAALALLLGTLSQVPARPTAEQAA